MFPYADSNEAEIASLLFFHQVSRPLPLDNGIGEVLRCTPEALGDSALQNFDLVHQHVGAKWTPKSIMDVRLS